MVRYLAVLALAACGRLEFQPFAQVSGDAAGGPGDDGARSGTSDSGSGDASAGAGGSGTITGSVGTCPGFTGVATAYAMGQTIGPNEIAVVLMSAYLPCSMMGSPGWIGNLPDNSIAVGLSAGGTTAVTYPVDLNYDPPAGTAVAGCYQILGGSGNADDGALSGTLQLMSIGGDGSVTGTFSATFFDGTFSGSFNAAPCPTGIAI